MLVLLFIAVGLVGTRTTLGAAVDDRVWSLVLNGLPPRMRQPLDQLAREVAPVALAAVAALLALLALVRRRWRHFCAGVLLAVLPSLLTINVHLQDPSGPVGGSYPSNHATAAFSLLAACVVLWPVPVGRVTLSVAGLAALCIGMGNVTWYAHAPRDVVGSLVVVLGVGDVRRHPLRSRRPQPGPSTPCGAATEQLSSATRRPPQGVMTRGSTPVMASRSRGVRPMRSRRRPAT